MLICQQVVVVVVPKYNFNEMLRSIERHRINSLMVVPPQVVLLCKVNGILHSVLRSELGGRILQYDALIYLASAPSYVGLHLCLVSLSFAQYIFNRLV